MTHWRDRFPEEVTCVRCLQVREAAELDRLLWCESCREAGRARAGRIGWAVAVLFAAFLVAWIWWGIRPVTLRPAVWAVSVFAALWLVAKVAREVVYGIDRYWNRKAREAVPPLAGRGADNPDPEEEGP